MLDADGRINPDLERPPVSGFRAHAERVVRRWLASLGLVWYARTSGGGLLELLNSPGTVAELTAKAQELRQQAMAEPGTTSARVAITRNDATQTITINASLDVRGYSGTIRINMNSTGITAEIG
jgi:DNA primase